MSFLRLSILISVILTTYSQSMAQDLSRSDGYKDTAVFNGNQNMPVTLYGDAMEWDLDCLKGKTDKCMRLALALERGDGDLEPEIRAALGYYVSACEKGDGAGCTRAATIIRAGSANFVNMELAQQTAIRGCDQLGHQDACVVKALGLSGEEKQQMNALIDQACDDGSVYGCEIKATSLFYDRDDETSHKAAVKLFDDACDDDQAWGCAGLAKAYETGIGVEKDDADAFKLARKGCLDAEGDTVASCALYGRYLTENGSLDDLDLGVKLLTRACLAQNGDACFKAGDLGWKRPASSGIADWEVPLYFRDGCDLDNADACFSLASLYMEGYGPLNEYQDTPMKLLDKACELGSLNACNHIASLGEQRERIYRRRPPKVDPALTAEQQLSLIIDFEKQRKYGIAKHALVRLMNEGVAEASWLLGGWAYYGHPGIFDQPYQSTGVTLIENAARQRHTEAAKWIAMAYWYGDGVDMDRDKGLGYMEIAAASGDNMAKDIYRSMLAEPIRQDFARRQQEMEAEAERRKNDWGYQISLANARWTQAMSGSSASGSANQQRANAAWQRSQSALDKLHWNNAIGYSTGRTTACPISNPYC